MSRAMQSGRAVLVDAAKRHNSAARIASAFPISRRIQDALNQQIHAELNASMAYITMAAQCAPASESQPGLSHMLRAGSLEEAGHGAVLARWLLSRGGVCALPALQTVAAPGAPAAPCTARAALQASMRMERGVTESLLRLHAHATDPSTAQFVTKALLRDQVEALFWLGLLYAKLQRVSHSPRGLRQFDEMLRRSYQT